MEMETVEGKLYRMKRQCLSLEGSFCGMILPGNLAGFGSDFEHLKINLVPISSA